LKTLKLFLITIGLILLGFGSLALIGNIANGSANGNGFIIPVVLIAIGFFLFIFPLISLRSETKGTAVIGIARGHKKIMISDLAGKAGVSEHAARKLIYDAIAKGNLQGTIEGDVFIRSEGTSTGVTVEREVMVARKIPETCFKCNASLNPQEVEWVGPDSVRCPHCGATIAISTERI